MCGGGGGGKRVLYVQISKQAKLDLTIYLSSKAKKHHPSNSHMANNH